MKIIDLDTVLKIQKCWNANTTVDKKSWSNNNKASGQCAVTSLLVNDLFGGVIVNQIVSYDNESISHYCNVVDDCVIDLTISQFPKYSLFSDLKPKFGDFSSTREYLLFNEDTNKRYLLLKRTYDNLK